MKTLQQFLKHIKRRMIKIVHEKYKFMYAHVDGLILPETHSDFNRDLNNDEGALLECKHTNAFSNPKKLMLIYPYLREFFARNI